MKQNTTLSLQQYISKNFETDTMTVNWDIRELFSSVPFNILCMLFASLNILFVYAWHDNLLGIINYIDRHIELDNIERVQRALLILSHIMTNLHNETRLTMGVFVNWGFISNRAGDMGD